jgi:translation initiation factor 1
MKHKPGSGGLVYSTEVGRTCPVCRQAIDACTCASGAAPSGGNGVVRILRERKGRAGKTVTVIEDVPLAALALAGLCQKLKNRCGTGGTTKGQSIELQGDHVDTALALLSAEGFTVKRSGG